MATLARLSTPCQQTTPDVVVRGPLHLEALGMLTILAYAPHYRDDFRRLNLEWIEPYFGAESLDHLVLADPETYFLAPGGAIFFAQHCGEIVGTCALMKHPECGFELAKMGVTRLYRGMHIGRTLAETALAHARACGATSIFLETNSKLLPAVHLYTALGFRPAPFPRGRSGRYQRADTYMVLSW